MLAVSENPTEKGTEKYEVGYGKPPLETRFGGPRANPQNPGGMPKGTVSGKRLMRKAAADPTWKPTTPLGEIVLRSLETAREGKTRDALDVLAYHDEGFPETPEEVRAAQQHETTEQERRAVIAWHRKHGEEDIAKAMEEADSDE